jgi:hypothetical protein
MLEVVAYDEIKPGQELYISCKSGTYPIIVSKSTSISVEL